MKCYRSEIGEPVKPKRAYNSTRRQAQAETTKRGILETATRLFVGDGYVVTTIEAIATEAGVSAKTVYDGFATKAGVLRGVWDLGLKGDTNTAPVAARPWYLEVVEAPTVEAAVALLAKNSVAVKQRIGPILRVIRDAAVLDDEAASLWRLINTDFHDNQRNLMEAIARKGSLRPGISLAKATDLAWTYNHPDVWLLLHAGRGWSPRAFETWLDESIRALFA